MGYSDELRRLNKAQAQAVDTINGALLVIAGPGTGKTQLLAMRVANILRSTDTPASALLCLTFTNKAAINMRSRILELTDQKAVDVTVKTFHSFASEIMSLYPDQFWNGARLSLAPDTLQLEIVQNILKSLPLDNPLALKFAGQYTLTNDIIEALKLVKEAGLTPDKLRALIELNLAYIDEIEKDFTESLEPRLSIKKLDELDTAINTLPAHNADTLISPLISLSTVIRESLAHAIQLDKAAGKTTHTGAWKRRWVQSIAGEKGMHQERDRNKWWLALADVYSKYRQELHERGYYDYADMLVEVITQLETNSAMRSDIQEKFLYVMIDEFQDTNPAQMRLAHLIADHHTGEGNPNLMAVGDDDQSIFKFNGAELNNMLSFKRSYPHAKTIILTENYRSTQTILDLSQKVINSCEDRLVKRDPSLKKTLTAKSEIKPGSEQLFAYHDRDTQLSEIARHIKSHYGPNRSMAVIARGHGSLRDMAARLLALGLPVHYEQQRNVLDHVVVNQVILIGEAIHSIRMGDRSGLNAALSNLLSHPMWQIDSKNLWNIAKTGYAKGDWLEALDKSKSTKWIADVLLSITKDTTNTPLGLAMEYLLGLRALGEHTSPIKAYFSTKQEDKSEFLNGLSAIQYLRRMADEYSSSPQASLQDFLDVVRIERDNQRVVTDESPLVVGKHGIHLLTVHKAKGLEFDDVYIIDAIEKNWSPRKGGRKTPANLPLRPPGDDMDDFVRLMYVAVTRAKQNLFASYYLYDSVGNEVLPSHVIRSALKPQAVQSKLPLIDIVAEASHWPLLPQSDMKQALQGRLSEYSLSVTHLLNFLDVTKGGPQYFLERNLLRLPEPKTTSLAHGTAMHDALELAQRLINQGKYSLKQVQQRYLSSLREQHLPRSEANRYETHGPKELERLLQPTMLNFTVGVTPEQRLKDVMIGAARLNGTLDTLQIQEDEIVITDYKTGRPLPSFNTRDQNLQIKAYKHRLQLIYYALLVRRSPHFAKYRSHRIIGRIAYVEATNPKDLIRNYEPSDKEIEHLELLIQSVWRHIVELDLPDISNYSCDYQGIADFESKLISELNP